MKDKKQLGIRHKETAFKAQGITRKNAEAGMHTTRTSNRRTEKKKKKFTVKKKMYKKIEKNI